MANQDHDISVLNGLIATTLDSAAGYAEAAKDADNTRYIQLFRTRAEERSSVASKLQSEVVRLGGQPEDEGTTLASMHRMFTNLRNSIAGGDTAVVDEVERGEDHIKHKFEDALADEDLSTMARNVVEQAFVSVKSGHDQMRDLKHSLHH
ncbi:MAG TPA: PA2169 family four-helix-bundle protein [Sphingomonadaceae bacterium]|nr:PA2169 family four-helix-bundle protein [Sphingomonadaceae bacterium]